MSHEVLILGNKSDNINQRENYGHLFVREFILWIHGYTFGRYYLDVIWLNLNLVFR
jgi:hypothetical protein